MWWLLAVAALAVGYWLLKKPYKYWEAKGVKQSNPWLIMGDMWGMISRSQSLAGLIEMVYNNHPNTRYSGCYQFFSPVLVLRDPDLIKHITVKDFDHFVDHTKFIPEDVDPLWANTLFGTTGDKWRNLRTTISPAFTISKMKIMFCLISQCGEQFVNHFLNKNEDLITLEMKDIFTRLANDVIASTAFGVKCDSLGDRNNEFYLMGKEATGFGGFWKKIKFLFLLIPKMQKIVKFPFFPQRVSDFFSKLVKSNIESREKHGIVRPDMINVLLESRKKSLKHDDFEPSQDTGFATVQEEKIGKSPRTKVEITDELITAVALGFFFAGFESISSMMCFMSHELGVNPDLQQKLIQEVDETLEACNGKLTYEALLGMKYMDMVVSETLRKWPIAVCVDRVCTKPYTIEAKTSDERPVHLEKNAVVWLPIFGLHRDPQYYPDPERFDPERFSDENKGKIKPYTYLPFGAGPRNCLGSRFALLETKTLIFYILSNFEIVPLEKTQIPLKIATMQISLTAEGGFWLGLKRRK